MWMNGLFANDFSRDVNNKYQKLENKLLKIESVKGIDISKYLLKYADTQQFSNKEREHFYSKYNNQYVELPMIILVIKKIDTRLYSVIASIYARDSGKLISVSVSATVYTKNKEESEYLEHYRTADDYPFEEQETVLLKGKFKADGGGGDLGDNLEPAIIKLPKS
jgi:hypothetical protein